MYVCGGKTVNETENEGEKGEESGMCARAHTHTHTHTQTHTHTSHTTERGRGRGSRVFQACDILAAAHLERNTVSYCS